MPRISVVPKISIRKKPLAISGMITRINATSQAAGLLSSGQARTIARRTAEAGWLAWSWVPWINDMSSPREQALRPQRQHQHHDQEGYDNRVGRDVDRAELLGEANNDGAEGCARNRAHAADDYDHQRGEQETGVLARRNRLERAADNAGDAGKARTEGEDKHEDELNPHPGGGQDVAIVDAGAHDHADPGAVERKPHGNADHDGGCEDHEP